MKPAFSLLLIALIPLATTAAPRHDLPSCDLNVQRALQAPVGGEIKDERQAHIFKRADVLDADIASARESRQLSKRDAGALSLRVEHVRNEAAALVRKQGFLSAGERASYDREFDEIAGRICS